MNLPTKRLAPLILAGTALLGACSAGSSDEAAAPSSIAFSERPSRPSTTLVEAAPEIEMSPEEELITDFEANWVCTMQASAFDSAGAIEDTRADLLIEYGIDSDDYLAFRDVLDSNRDLRDVVLFKYQEQCG